MAKIQLNGKKVIIQSNYSLFDLLQKYKLINKKVAVEHNGVIIPKANYKIFLWAASEVRAKRRYDQLRKNGKNVSYIKIFKEINVRDQKDMTREIAPLMPAANSVLLDTSYIDIEQAFNAIKQIILKTKNILIKSP